MGNVRATGDVERVERIEGVSPSVGVVDPPGTVARGYCRCDTGRQAHVRAVSLADPRAVGSRVSQREPCAVLSSP
jgi:hypothetical protein